MKKIIHHFFLRPFPYWDKVEFFRSVLYIFLILNTLSLLPYSYELFAYDGAVGTRGWRMGVPWYFQGSEGLLNFLSHPINNKYEWLYLVFVIGQLIFLTLGLFRILPRLSALLIYIFTANLFLKGYLAFTGGEVLINLLLFYLIFIQKGKPSNALDDKSTFLPIQNLINNTFYWIVLIQICMVYVYAVLYKVFDPYWLDGTALYHISKIEVFSSNWFRSIFSDNILLSKIATYTVLLYQLFFPILVWVKIIKIPLLVLGIVIHLGIAFGMGIFTFGWIMIICYILFLSNAQVDTIKKRFTFGH